MYRKTLENNFFLKTVIFLIRPLVMKDNLTAIGGAYTEMQTGAPSTLVDFLSCNIDYLPLLGLVFPLTGSLSQIYRVNKSNADS